MKRKKKKKVKKKVVRKPRKKKVIKKARKRVVKKRKGKLQKPKKKISSLSSVPAGVSLEEVGVITHYFPHVEAAVVKLTKGSLSMGDRIIIKGHTTDFKGKVTSMQLNHVPITTASVGQEIGLGIKSKVRDHDTVYKLVG